MKINAFFAVLAIGTTITLLGCSDKNSEIETEVSMPTTSATAKSQPINMDESDDITSELGLKLATNGDEEKDEIQTVNSGSSSDVLTLE